MIEVMARPPRYDPEHGWHHVMNRGANRRAIYFSENDRTEFGQRLAQLNDRFGIETHAYCLLDNHFHLLLHCPHAGLSVGMQQLSSIFTRHVNDRMGRDGPLFRGRFLSRPVRSDRYLLAACRYIHRNALDVHGVEDISTYRWSSLRTYLGYRRCPPWMRTDAVLDLFASTGDFESFMRNGQSRPDRVVNVESARDTMAAARIVLAEIGGSATDERLGVLARATTIAALEGRPGFDHQLLVEALDLPSAGAARTARSRAKAAHRTDAIVREAVARTLLLTG
jgi:REP element-mobilizing transposase RayT